MTTIIESFRPAFSVLGGKINAADPAAYESGIMAANDVVQRLGNALDGLKADVTAPIPAGKAVILKDGLHRAFAGIELQLPPEVTAALTRSNYQENSFQQGWTSTLDTASAGFAGLGGRIELYTSNDRTHVLVGPGLSNLLKAKAPGVRITPDDVDGNYRSAGGRNPAWSRAT